MSSSRGGRLASTDGKFRWIFKLDVTILQTESFSSIDSGPGEKMSPLDRTTVPAVLTRDGHGMVPLDVATRLCGRPLRQ